MTPKLYSSKQIFRRRVDIKAVRSVSAVQKITSMTVGAEVVVPRVTHGKNRDTAIVVSRVEAKLDRLSHFSPDVTAPT